jgi:hypothetical protein
MLWFLVLQLHARGFQYLERYHSSNRPVQLTFWRRTTSELAAVPIGGLHANSRGDFIEQGLKCTDVVGLANGYTLIATNKASLLVVDKLKLIKTVFGLDGSVTRLMALGGTRFAATSDRQTLDLFTNELEHEEIAGTSSSNRIQLPAPAPAPARSLMCSRSFRKYTLGVFSPKGFLFSGQ